MIDWNKVLIRCSSLGSLMTEPKDAAAKKAGELSETAKTELKRIYISLKYGREKEFETKYTKKGLDVEEESITLVSRVYRKMLYKNEGRLTNEYISGLPDIYEGESIRNAQVIRDIKSSYDIFTFIENIGKPLDNNYKCQLQGYLALSGAPLGYIDYCLVDAPAGILESEKYRLLKKMNVISDESPEYIAEAMKLDHLLTYPDIPISERVLSFRVDRDDEFIERIYDKVRKARLWLAEFEQRHINFNTIK